MLHMAANHQADVTKCNEFLVVVKCTGMYIALVEDLKDLQPAKSCSKTNEMIR